MLSDLPSRPPPRIARAFLGGLRTVGDQARIIGALVMREMSTRFGRQGLGFAWLIGEPLLFCFGVLILWTATKPEYEHGVRLAPFIMTGYMSLILTRHMIGLLGNALQANLGLLYHRKITPIHLFSARILLEMGGATGAFFVVYLTLLALGQVDAPHDLLLLYSGWFLLAWVSIGFSLVLAGLVMRFEMMERLVGLISYSLIPISGVFFMVAWLPPAYREIYLLIPFVHGVEMIRAGVFGEFVPTYYDPAYALFCGAIMNVLGLLIIAGARDRIESE